MRFARHAKLFRSPLDPAPVAAVLFLLMMFMLVGSLVYTPGVLVELSPAAAAATITISSSNDVAFAGRTYKPGELDQLRTDLKSVPAGAGFSIAVEPGANPSLARQVSNLFQIALPEGKNLTGTDDATVMVAVNFRGQCFYENRLVQDAELKTELMRRVKIAARDSKKLTLLLRMDKAAETQVFTRLSGLANDAGITKVLVVERPPMFGGQP
jgi:biopolymer transport protein ExbD